MRLVDDFICDLKPKVKPYKCFDGKNLYIEISPKGTKVWRYKYKFDGKEKRLTFGRYPKRNILVARSFARMAEYLLSQGNDPACASHKPWNQNFDVKKDMLIDIRVALKGIPFSEHEEFQKLFEIHNMRLIAKSEYEEKMFHEMLTALPIAFVTKINKVSKVNKTLPGPMKLLRIFFNAYTKMPVQDFFCPSKIISFINAHLDAKKDYIGLRLQLKEQKKIINKFIVEIDKMAVYFAKLRRASLNVPPLFESYILTLWNYYQHYKNITETDLATKAALSTRQSCFKTEYIRAVLKSLDIINIPKNKHTIHLSFLLTKEVLAECGIEIELEDYKKTAEIKST